MPLKPSDIEQKTFATAFKGYDLAEVDDFLDEVIATIRDLEERVASGGSGPALSATSNVDESAIGRALVAAQTAADKILEDARAEAERINAEALTDAERIKADAVAEADNWQIEKDAKQAEARQTISALNERVESVRRELAALVNTLADGVEEMDSVLDGAGTFVGAGDPDGLESVSLDSDSASGDDDEDDDLMDLASVDSDSASDDDDDFEAWQLDMLEEPKS